jgi:hypothetical protein
MEWNYEEGTKRAYGKLEWIIIKEIVEERRMVGGVAGML